MSHNTPAHPRYTRTRRLARRRSYNPKQIYTHAYMTYIKREDLLEAIVTVNAASGTQTIYRTVESQLINRFTIPVEIIDTSRLDREFSIVDHFRRDVCELAAMLENDGSYYDAEQRCYFTSPKRIANEMIDSGLSWVTEAKVREAKRMKRG